MKPHQLRLLAVLGALCVTGVALACWTLLDQVDARTPVEGRLLVEGARASNVAPLPRRLPTRPAAEPRPLLPARDSPVGEGPTAPVPSTVLEPIDVTWSVTLGHPAPPENPGGTAPMPGRQGEHVLSGHGDLVVRMRTPGGAVPPDLRVEVHAEWHALELMPGGPRVLRPRPRRGCAYAGPSDAGGLVVPDERESPCRPAVWETALPRDGVLRMLGAPVGVVYSVHVLSADGARLGACQARLVHGSRIERQIRLRSTPRPVEVLVLGPEAQPVRGAEVRLSCAVRSSQVSRSDETGRVRIPSWPSDELSLRVTHPDFAPRFLSSVTVPVHGLDQTVQLEPGRTLELVFRDESGRPPAVQIVSAVRPRPFWVCGSRPEAVSLPLLERLPIQAAYRPGRRLLLTGLPDTPVQLQVEVPGGQLIFVEDGKQPVVTLMIPSPPQSAFSNSVGSRASGTRCSTSVLKPAKSARPREGG